MLYIIIKEELLYGVFGMIKFLKSVFNRVFNSVIANGIIIVVIVVSQAPYVIKWVMSHSLTMPRNEKPFIIAIFLLGFFVMNIAMIMENKNAYMSLFSSITKFVISVLIIIAILLILLLCVKLNLDNFENFLYTFKNFAFLAISVTLVTWSIYLNCCIRVLSNINVEWSTFIAIAVKAFLIAIVAWLALYKDSVTDKSSIINFITSYISLCYPIIDMYKYVRLELNKYMEENTIIYK